MKRSLSILLCLLACTVCKSQTAGFLSFAGLGNVPATGFYRVLLTPDITSHLKADFSDIRITDSAGRWVPHLLVQPGQAGGEAINYTLNFRVAENSGLRTTIIITGRADTISNLIFEMNNSAVQRYWDVSGSNDGNNWSAINDSILPSPAAPFTKTTSLIGLKFPPVAYAFYKVNIHNGNSDPFGILHISTPGSGVPLIKDARVIWNPPAIITRLDSNKASFFRLAQDADFLNGFLEIGVTGPAYFSRSALLYIVDPRTAAAEPVARFPISNNGPRRFRFAPAKARAVFLVIQNDDNPPLTVVTARTGYADAYLVSYLEAGKNYHLYFDNASAAAPNYDLPNMPALQYDTLPLLAHGKAAQLQTQARLRSNNNSGKLLLWIVLGCVLAVLLYFSFTMLKEINNRDDNL